jgi:4-amino-4-deoxy-L-arabinose transferase-like glycosyltransferase
MNASVQENTAAGTYRGAGDAYLALGLFALALAMRSLIVIITQFDGLYGQDGFAYFECAQQFAGMRYLQNPCSDFYWPLGYPALAALFMLGTHGTPAGAQFASILTGSAIAPLAFWAVIASGDPAAQIRKLRYSAVAAGLIAAFCGQLILSSIVIMSDAPGLFWATLSACMLLQWQGSAGGRSHLWLPAAAVALALAATTRWIFGGLLLPFGAFTLIVARRKRDYQALLAAAVLLSAILGAQLYSNSLSSAPVLHHSWVENWTLRGAWRFSFDNPDGHFDYRVPPVIFNAAAIIHPVYLCPVLAIFVALGAWRLRRSPALILLGGWMAMVYGYLIGIPYENGRFPLAYFSPVAVLAGIGLWQVPLRVRLVDSARWGLLALSLAVTAAFTYRGFLYFDSATKQQFAAIRYVEAHVPRAAAVVTFGLSISLAHYSKYTVIDLFMQSPQSLRALICGGPAVYLFVDKDNLETQWAGRSPALNFHWLENSIGLTPAGSEGTWILFRVQPCGR